MNKPASMSITDFFIKKTALKTLISESVVSAVISHQWKSANEATKKNEEVEISGLGKFLVSKPKILKRIEKLEMIKKGFQKVVDTSDDERKVNITKNKVAAVEQRIQDLKSKLHD